MAQQTAERTRDSVRDTFGIGDADGDMGNMPIPQGYGAGPSILPTARGETSINTFGGTVTAQRVAVGRDMVKIRNELAALAQMAGSQWVYAWDVKDRKANRMVHIEGPTIKLANDLARTWGNCRVDVMVDDQGSHWMFYGRFTDLETGYTLVRGFQQRKAQNVGMKDDARASDMIFQLGQSKAIRNVVVNALQTLATFCMEEAKTSVKEKIGKNPDAARAKLVAAIEAEGVDIKRVEKVYGRSSANWTVPDMAKINQELSSIQDNMSLATDVWPLAEDEQQTGDQTVVPPGGATTAPAAEQHSEPEHGTSAGASAAATTTTTESPKAPAAAPTLAEGERVVMLEGGVPLGKMGPNAVVKVGVEYEMFNTKLKVISFNETEIVVERAAPAPADPPAPAAAAAKPAAKAKAPAAKKSESKLFGDD